MDDYASVICNAGRLREQGVDLPERGKTQSKPDPLSPDSLLGGVMKLITPEFEALALFKDYPLYSQKESDDPFIAAKLFDPMGNTT